MVAEARSKRPNRICCLVWGSSMEPLDSLGEIIFWDLEKTELKKINPLVISLLIFPHSYVYLP